MSIQLNNNDLDDFEDEFEPHVMRPPRNPSKQNKPKKKASTLADQALEQMRQAERDGVATAADVFNPTYKGSRHEQEMILGSLQAFYADRLLADVLHVVKGGKEATVYCCKAHPELGVPLVAAKIYRPRMFRNLKNDAMYRVGTQMRDASGGEMRKSREQRAVGKRTSFGLSVLHSSWLSNEVGIVRTLHTAGVLVPKVYANNDNAVLMSYIGEQGYSAPPLESVVLERRTAQRVFEVLLENIKLMLANDVVHGDLSAYNILFWQDQPCIIDFPQAVHPYKNPLAYDIFVRDVERVCDYFVRYHITPDPTKLAQQLWREVMGLDGSRIQEIQTGRWNARRE